jgi:hypothetical protein
MGDRILFRSRRSSLHVRFNHRPVSREGTKPRSQNIVLFLPRGTILQASGRIIELNLLFGLERP